MREIVLKAAEEEEEGVVAEVVVLAEVVVVVLVEVVEGVADPAEGVAVDVLSVESLVTFLVIVGSVNFVVVEFVRFIFLIKFRMSLFLLHRIICLVYVCFK